MCLKKYMNEHPDVVVWGKFIHDDLNDAGISSRRYEWTSPMEAKYARLSGVVKILYKNAVCWHCLHSQSRMDVWRHDMNRCAKSLKNYQ